MKRLTLMLFAVLVAASPFAHAAAEPKPTEIVVRAKAHDAKFIGTSMGSAWVRIVEADSGKLLAEGPTEGGTGNTDAIMKQPRGRYTPIAEGAAAFRTVLQLSEPTFVTVEVSAPHIQRQARVLSQTQLWLIPGKAIDGDGLIIEIPGMVVDVLSPQTHNYVQLGDGPFDVTANVVMMCGCPITSGGLWDGDGMEVAALIYRDDQPFLTLPLKMQEQANTFSARFAPKEPGVYRFTIYAYDPRTGNTGVDQTSFIVGR